MKLDKAYTEVHEVCSEYLGTYIKEIYSDARAAARIR